LSAREGQGTRPLDPLWGLFVGRYWNFGEQHSFSLQFLKPWNEERAMTAGLTSKVQSTRDEFLRQLPDAIGNAAYRVQGDQIVVGSGAKVVKIQLTDLGIEDIGSLHLPMQQVDFSFEAMSDAEIDAFMTNWDEHKMRMGG
jgi:hypothetical protein